MAKSTLSRHGRIRVAAVALSGGLIFAACSPMSDQPAPVYMVNIVSTAAPETAAAAPIEREAMAPVALAPSMVPAIAAGQPTSDAIPLDNPPPQPASAPARQAADPVATLPPPSAPAPTPALTPARTLVASPAPIAPPAATPPVAASARPEPSAVPETRAEAASPPVRERATAEPARADIATPALYVSVKADRAARSRPHYYYSP